MKFAASAASGDIPGAVGLARGCGIGKRTAVGVDSERGGGFAGGGRDDPSASVAAGGFSAGSVCGSASEAAGGRLSRGGSGAEASGGGGDGSTHSIFADDAARPGIKLNTRRAAETEAIRSNLRIVLRFSVVPDLKYEWAPGGVPAPPCARLASTGRREAAHKPMKSGEKTAGPRILRIFEELR